MRVLLPLLSLGKNTTQSNPSQSTSSHGKKNQSSRPNLTKDSKKKYEAISNHAYKRSKKTQITFMDIDLIINSKFIGSQQTHRKKELHQIDLQETIVSTTPTKGRGCRSKQSHPSIIKI